MKIQWELETSNHSLGCQIQSYKFIFCPHKGGPFYSSMFENLFNKFDHKKIGKNCNFKFWLLQSGFKVRVKKLNFNKKNVKNR